MAHAIYEKLKATKKLPSPAGVALEILRLVDAENTPIGAIASVIESDPALSAQLLGLVNSPIAGIARPIASVRQAVALLGLRTVKRLALGFSLVSNSRRGRCSGFDYDGFWSESLGRAVSARHVADRVGDFAPDEAFTCGLLSQIGRLGLATAHPESYAVLLRTIGRDAPAAVAEKEQGTFGIDHNGLTAEMMADWHLPELFCDAVRSQDAPDAQCLDPDGRPYRLGQALLVSGLIARVLTEPEASGEALATVHEEARLLGIDASGFEDVFDAIRAAWRRAGGIFVIATRDVPSLKQLEEMAAERRRVIASHERPRDDCGVADALGRM